jgi:hypothetical protein
VGVVLVGTLRHVVTRGGSLESRLLLVERGGGSGVVGGGQLGFEVVETVGVAGVDGVDGRPWLLHCWPRPTQRVRTLELDWLCLRFKPSLALALCCLSLVGRVNSGISCLGTVN